MTSDCVHKPYRKEGFIVITARSAVISAICFILLVFGFTGCADNPQNQSSENSEVPQIVSLETEASHYFSDYNQFLKKIWVTEDWDGGAYSQRFSFSITKIENEKIEGFLFTGEIAKPKFYSSYYLNNPNLPDFADVKDMPQTNLTGSIKNDIAQCQFDDDDGNKGKVTFLFKESNKIEATIKYTDKSEAYEDVSSYGTYLFRPYNLSDLKSFTKNEENSFFVDLNSWDSVCFVSGEFRYEKSYGSQVTLPQIYLTDEQDNIFYKFDAPFQTATKITNAYVEDINGDGLKDVTVITGFADYDTGSIYSDMPKTEWRFIQMENGLFYDSNLDLK